MDAAQIDRPVDSSLRYFFCSPPSLSPPHLCAFFIVPAFSPFPLPALFFFSLSVLVFFSLLLLVPFVFSSLARSRSYSLLGYVIKISQRGEGRQRRLHGPATKRENNICGVARGRDDDATRPLGPLSSRSRPTDLPRDLWHGRSTDENNILRVRVRDTFRLSAITDPAVCQRHEDSARAIRCRTKTSGSC